jgi:anti-anti-sigma factor
MPLQIEVSQREGAGGALAHVVRFHGSLDNDTYLQAEKTLKPVIDKPHANVVLNLQDLTFLSSAGISVLLSTRKQLEAKKVAVAAIGMRPSIKKVFDIVKALPAAQVFTSIREMDDYLAAIQRRAAEEE